MEKRREEMLYLGLTETIAAGTSSLVEVSDMPAHQRCQV